MASLQSSRENDNNNDDALRDIGVEEEVEIEVTRTTIRNIQRELNRVGCSAGKVDGLWGETSRRALSQYQRHAGVNLVSLEPTIPVLRDLSAQTARICPLSCRSGYRIKNGRCTRIRREVKAQKTQPSQRVVVEPAPEPKKKSVLSILTGGRSSGDPLKSILLPILAPSSNGNKVCVGCKNTK
jgi:hypothetical protein